MLKAIGHIVIFCFVFTEAFGDDRLRDLHYETLGLGERTQKDISAVNSQFLDPEYADEYFFKNNLHVKSLFFNLQQNSNKINLVALLGIEPRSKV